MNDDDINVEGVRQEGLLDHFYTVGKRVNYVHHFIYWQPLMTRHAQNGSRGLNNAVTGFIVHDHLRDLMMQISY